MVVSRKAAAVRLDVQRIELPNGLVLLISENHSTPSVSISAVVQAGSRFEDDDRAGLAFLAAELVEEGTSSRSAEEIAEAIDSVGGHLLTMSDYQSNRVAVVSLSKDFDLGLNLASDLLRNAVFPEERVRRQIERRVAQIKSRLDVPRTLASDLFNESVFRGTPQHRPTIGYERTVNNLTSEEIREFYRHYYVPNNTLLSIAGDVDTGEVIAKVEAAFGDWPRATAFAPPFVARPDPNAPPALKHAAASKEQVNIFMGHVGIERMNRDYHSLMVMDTILGSSPGFTSRIPRILRDEQGLAYSTYSNITSSAGIDPGRFVAYIGTAPANLDRARAGLEGEIRRIVEEPVSPQELEVAQSYLTGSFVLRFQKNSQITEFMLDAEIYRFGFDYLERYPDLIREVTVDDVTHATRRHIHPDRLTTAIVGPVDEREAKGVE